MILVHFSDPSTQSVISLIKKQCVGTLHGIHTCRKIWDREESLDHICVLMRILVSLATNISVQFNLLLKQVYSARN